MCLFAGAFGISCDGDSRSVTISRCEIHHVDGGIYISGKYTVLFVSMENWLRLLDY